MGVSKNLSFEFLNVRVDRNTVEASHALRQVRIRGLDHQMVPGIRIVYFRWTRYCSYMSIRIIKFNRRSLTPYFFAEMNRLIMLVNFDRMDIIKSREKRVSARII